MKIFILSLVLCLTCCDLVAQDFDLLGLVDDQLIKINSSSNTVELIGDLNPSPTELVRFLTFVEEECLLYGVMDPSYNPTLISIDLDLNFTVIGAMTLPGSPLYFCETLAFNSSDNTMYAGVSINGDIASGDYSSEVIVEVDRLTAECQFITEIVENVPSPDIDKMTFDDNTLYFHDGQPGSWSKFFELEFIDLGPTDQVPELLSVGYIPTKDMEFSKGVVYYTTGRDLSYFDPISNSITDLGILFTSSDFDNNEITGLCINPFPDYLSLGDDVTICNGDEYLLELDYPYSNITWNNGSIGNSILASEPGLYWADVDYNNCTFRTDTVEVFIFLTELLSLGTDTVICQGETITLGIDEPDAIISWSDGSSGVEISISESGSFWAVYEVDGCIYYTDSINVEVVEDVLSIGEDIVMCEGESYTINIEGLGQNISWNNGYTGNNLVITQPGLYWAEIEVDECELLTDTIEVLYIEPYDIFIGSHSSICEGENLTIIIDEPNVEIVWNNGVVGNELVVSEAGLYWAVYIVDGCIFTTDTIFVEVINNVYDLGGDVSICEGESHVFDLGGVGGIVLWSNGQIGNQLIVTEEGEYWAEIEVEGCQSVTNVVNVSIVQIQNIDIGSDTLLCGEDEVTLTISNSSLDMLWSTGEISNTILVEEDGVFWVSSLNEDCPSESDTIEVRFIEEPILVYDFDTLVCIGEELDLSSSTYDISWNNDDGENLTLINETGNYWGSYHIDQCRFETDTLSARFVDCTPCQYYVPNIISPNSDNINDEFKVIFSNSCDLIDIEISIYDRWGNLMAKSKENNWNGEFNFKPVENGVYAYSITMNILKYNGEIQEMSMLGDITVIR